MDVQGSARSLVNPPPVYASFADLSDEVVLFILAQLPFVDLLAASGVNKRLRFICNDWQHLQGDALLVRMVTTLLGIKQAPIDPTQNKDTLEVITQKMRQIYSRLEKAGIAELATFVIDSTQAPQTRIEPVLRRKVVHEHGRWIRQTQSCFAKGFFEVGEHLMKTMSPYSLDCFLEAMENKVGVKHLLMNLSLPPSLKSHFFNRLAENAYHFDALTLQGDRGGDWFSPELNLALAHSKNIKKMKFQCLLFQAREFARLSSALEGNATLEHLEINHFDLSEGSVSFLAKVIERPCMKVLSLEHASNHEVELIAAAAVNSPLRRIELRKSFVGKSAAEALIHLLKTNRCIAEFTLSQAVIGEAELSYLEEELGQLPSVHCKLPGKRCYKPIALKSAPSSSENL